MLNYWKTLSKDASTKQQTERWEKLFQNKETRYGYVDGFLDSFLGMQIRVLREQKGWNQTELAERTGMKQPRIHLLESMNYSAWSVNVLRRLAKAFDLRLVVKFEDFGSFVPEYFDDFDRENLKRRSFDKDVIFNSEERNKAETSLAFYDNVSKEHSNGTKAQNTKKIRSKSNSTQQLDLPFDTSNEKYRESANFSFAIEEKSIKPRLNPPRKLNRLGAVKKEEARLYIPTDHDYTNTTLQF